MKKRGRGRPASRFKYLKRNYTDLILIGLVIVLSIMSGFYFGSAFGFNMTEEQKQEERLVPVCQEINASKIFIEGLAEQCAQFYGGPVP